VTDHGERFVGFTESHDVDGIRALLEDGLDPNEPIRGRTPVEWMVEMYTRSPRFHECIRLLIEAGARIEDEPLRAVLLDDRAAVARAVEVENLDHCAGVMRLLLGAGAWTDVRLDGLRWGVGFPWETTIHDVTPISFAQCGLLPQFHRRPDDIYTNIESLLEAAGRPVPRRMNVPNAYLDGNTTP